MVVKVLNRSCEGVDIRWRDDDSLHPIFHHVAGFARRDLRQPAGGRLVGNFRAAFALRRKDMDRRLSQVSLRGAGEPHHLDTIVREFLEVGPHLGMD